MAEINLGNIKFNWKGAYAGGTAYVVDDVVSYLGSSYVCILASTGNVPTNGTYWNLMAQAGTNGTNGTDLLTTLTTRGDMVYRGASALERLPKGTAGYYLKQGANDPEWAEVSGGDVVKLASGNLTGSSVSIDGYYSSTYDFYKLILMNVRSTVSGRGFRFRFNSGGSALTASNYRFVLKGAYQNSGGTNDNQGGEWNNSLFNTNWDMSTGSDRGSMYQIDIYDPLDTTNEKFVNWIAAIDSTDATNLATSQAAGYYNDGGASAMSGITVFPQTVSNFGGGIWKLYGYKA